MTRAEAADRCQAEAGASGHEAPTHDAVRRHPLRVIGATARAAAPIRPWAVRSLEEAFPPVRRRMRSRIQSGMTDLGLAAARWNAIGREVLRSQGIARARDSLGVRTEPSHERHGAVTARLHRLG